MIEKDFQVVNNLSKALSGIYISDVTEDKYAEKASSCDDVSTEYYLEHFI